MTDTPSHTPPPGAIVFHRGYAITVLPDEFGRSARVVAHDDSTSVAFVSGTTLRETLARAREVIDELLAADILDAGIVRPHERIGTWQWATYTTSTGAGMVSHIVRELQERFDGMDHPTVRFSDKDDVESNYEVRITVRLHEIDDGGRAAA